MPEYVAVLPGGNCPIPPTSNQAKHPPEWAIFTQYADGPWEYHSQSSMFEGSQTSPSKRMKECHDNGMIPALFLVIPEP